MIISATLHTSFPPMPKGILVSITFYAESSLTVWIKRRSEPLGRGLVRGFYYKNGKCPPPSQREGLRRNGGTAGEQSGRGNVPAGRRKTGKLDSRDCTTGGTPRPVTGHRTDEGET